MNLREYGHYLESLPIFGEGFLLSFFNLLPVFLVLFVILAFFLLKRFRQSLVRKIIIGLSLIIGIGLVAGIWSYSFERFDLQVKTQQVNLGFKAKVAIFADIHIGKFKGKTWVDKVVEETNKIENLDAVLVAGDWTYNPKVITKQAFLESFVGLKNSKYPIYAVMGNHDVEKPGPKLRQELESALVELGVKIVDDKFVDFPNWRLVGVEDLWSDQYVGLVESNLSKDKANIALTHQPDVVRDYNKLKTKPILTLTGHTHCGQVRIPFLYKLALPVIDAYYDKGWYDVGNNSKLLITCGVGEVGLPLRLFNPPTVDVLEIG
jgi:uncharacterized protein